MHLKVVFISARGKTTPPLLNFSPRTQSFPAVGAMAFQASLSGSIKKGRPTGPRGTIIQRTHAERVPRAGQSWVLAHKEPTLSVPEDLGAQRVVLRGSEGEAMQSLLRDPGSKHTPDLTAVHSCQFSCRVWGDGNSGNNIMRTRAA